MLTICRVYVLVLQLVYEHRVYVVETTDLERSRISEHTFRRRRLYLNLELHKPQFY